MNVLVACEFSGTVRDAFTARGHYALSCDLLPSETPGEHYQGDVRDILNDGWDLMIAHPPCTYLCVSVARWFSDKNTCIVCYDEYFKLWRPIKSRRKQQDLGIEFVKELMEAPIPKICIENPVSIISTRIRKPDQIIQPWMFGADFTKTTCLWLKNLPFLKPTSEKPTQLKKLEIRDKSPTKTRWKERSRTYQGIGNAMAAQWGCE